MTDEELYSRGEQANYLLNHPLLKEVFDKIESDIMSMWERTSAKAKEEREELWLYYKTAVKVRKIFENMVKTGKQAEIRLERETMRSKLRKIF